jgi:hypothetical protein
MFRLTLALLGSALLLAGCSPQARPMRLDEREREGLLRGDPSKVIAAELAFARMAREKGTWTAFRETSVDDALWPSPGLTRVRQDLEGQSDPANPIVWEPDAVWVSCDGTFALSTGPATLGNGRRTRFATIWQRQRRRAGDEVEYRWVLDQGFDLEEGYAQPEFIGAKVAECPPSGPVRGRWREPEVQQGGAWGSGRSNDGTLEWSTAVAADCSRTLTVNMMQGGAMTEVFRRHSPAPAAPAGQPAPTCPA